MIIKKIGFSKTFPILINGQWEKHYTEADIEEGDDIRQCRYKLKKEIEEFFYESTKAAEKQMGTQYSQGEDISKSLSDVVDLIKQINSCTELKVLESYKLIVRGDEDLENAYNQMSIKLNLKEENL